MGDDFFVVDLPLTPERIRMARPALGAVLRFRDGSGLGVFV